MDRFFILQLLAEDFYQKISYNRLIYF